MRSKSIGIGITFLAVAVIWMFAGSSSQAFHSGGVAECGGCHSMHSAKVGGSRLLVGSDPSSTCLTCHQSTSMRGYYVATADTAMPTGVAPLQRTPGGDFGWLKKSYSWIPRAGAAAENEKGETHGHNIVAQDQTFIADAANTLAPGGTFSSSQLGCTSCHDPHGRVRRLDDGSYVTGANLGQAGAPIIGSGSYDNSVDPVAGQAVGAYRLLRGLNDATVSGVTFTGVAIAVAPATYNRTEATTQTRVAYGRSGTDTWGNWCASCHPNMHATGANIHPVDKALSATAAIYNAYVKSGDLTGLAASSFTSLVPFVEDTGTIATLKSHAKNNDSYLNGPATGDQVTCLSCHRAHASGWPEALRWNNEGEFMIYNSLFPGTDTTPTVPQFSRGRVGAETQAAYYDRPVTKFASYQRVLCNKCHAKD